MTSSWRPTRAEIDLDAIKHNASTLGAMCEPHVRKLAVVKANAYGHGAAEVARAAIDAGATHLGVALVEEGVALRSSGIDVPIITLIDPGAAPAKEIIEHDITPSVYVPATIDALDEAGVAAGTPANVHLCFDTGMHREGVRFEEVVDVARDITQRPGLELEGLWSHFAMGELNRHPFTLAAARTIQRRDRRGCRRPASTFPSATSRVRPAPCSIPSRTLTSCASGSWCTASTRHNTMRDLCELRPAMRLVSAVVRQTSRRRRRRRLVRAHVRAGYRHVRSRTSRSATATASHGSCRTSAVC